MLGLDFDNRNDDENQIECNYKMVNGQKSETALKNDHCPSTTEDKFTTNDSSKIEQSEDSNVKILEAQPIDIPEFSDGDLNDGPDIYELNQGFHNNNAVSGIIFTGILILNILCLFSFLHSLFL